LCACRVVLKQFVFFVGKLFSLFTKKEFFIRAHSNGLFADWFFKENKMNMNNSCKMKQRKSFEIKFIYSQQRHPIMFNCFKELKSLRVVDSLGFTSENLGLNCLVISINFTSILWRACDVKKRLSWNTSSNLYLWILFIFMVRSDYGMDSKQYHTVRRITE
jgi:hypothetical protein